MEAPPLCGLHTASKTGNLSRVKFLLSQERADVNCQEWIGRTPAMWAASGGHREVVELLVSNGAIVSLVDRFSINILHAACLGGDVEVVKYVISQNMLDINGKVRCGRTAVMLAAENRHKDVVELLVDKEANMSLVDKTGDNILHCACRGGSVEVVKYILSKKTVDIDGRGSKKMTPIMVARHCGHKDVVELLVSKTADGSLRYYNHITMLHSACQEGNMEMVKYVLSQNIVDIDSRGWKKKTPVMVAVEFWRKGDTQKWYSYLQVKELVCLLWMDIDSRGWKKRTPVMVAAEKGHTEVVQLLVSKGAGVSLVDGYGENILHWASVGGHVETVRYVLSLNIVDIDSRGWKKRTPVMVAAEKGHTEVVQLLVSKGAGVSLVDVDGDNILHWASVGGHVETVRYVLSQNIVDIDSRDWKKRTPAMAAAERGHTEVVQLLVSRGAELPAVTTANVI
ncbi:ankyrin repeat domain-containing protein 50-like [Haliotis rubra]|uniref:ankyrin repeat domain-containing protein 50-like n=1 Tax=Haliotis rubra TaxID=36100 RepID=UPI001EE57871|nr:ankyrin repeat domain-containing protein 50-like [Haliotis rubra]